MTPHSLWTGVLRRLEAEVGPFAMEAWVHPLTAEAAEPAGPTGDGLRLLCPSAFHRERVRGRLLERIARCAEAEAGRPVAVALEIGGPPRPAATPTRTATAGSSARARSSTSRGSSTTST